MDRSIRIDTLQKLRDGGYELSAHCTIDHTCHHCATLDLDVLIARFGPDFDFVDRRDELDAALRCGKCGRKGVGIRLSPPASSQTGGGTSMW